ncbi:MAG TPA: hypothetical protein VMW35_15315 [Myxococcota bacterium]|nr:hypothetical protein [Myxococcota bacterium]
MARRAIPDPLERRHLLEKELEAAQALPIAEAYLAEGRSVEALAFLRAAGATERLEALCGEAIDAGDAFLLRETCKALSRAPEAAEWRALAERAAACGKRLYEDQARRQLGREG